MFIRRSVAGLFMLLGVVPFGSAHAQKYPDHVVQIVAAFPPGGGVDVVARMLAQQMAEDLKQNVIVENKPGATGVIGASQVAAAPPDGYTMLFTASNLAIAPYLLPNNKFDVEKELTPISLVASIPYIMVVNPKIPASNPKELAEWIKKNPKEFRWGNGGVGSPDALAIEQFDKMAGIDPVVVPYTGTGPAVVATLSGEVGGMICSPSAALSLMASGQLKALGVTSATESDVVPGVPPVAKSGFPGFEILGWFALLGPKNMPAALAIEIQQDVLKALTHPEIKEKLNKSGITAAGTMTPVQFAAYLKSELVKYKGLVKPADAK